MTTRKNPIMAYAAHVAALLKSPAKKRKPAAKKPAAKRTPAKKNSIKPSREDAAYAKLKYAVDRAISEDSNVWYEVARFALKTEAFLYCRAAQKSFGGKWRVFSR